MRVVLRALALALLLTTALLGRSASAPVIGPTGHRINSDTKGCRSVEAFRALIKSAMVNDLETWDATLRTGACTSFHKGERVVLDSQQVSVEGVVKIHRIGAAVAYYTFALVVD